MNGREQSQSRMGKGGERDGRTWCRGSDKLGGERMRKYKSMTSSCGRRPYRTTSGTSETEMTCRHKHRKTHSRGRRGGGGGGGCHCGGAVVAHTCMGTSGERSGVGLDGD